jgi:NADH:ubiquinone oxidoreductase subunit 5 (subunit L)/multisubunit Na+/H+ antiporter MnhA subunit
MKISLYVLASVAILCAIPPFGYYVSFLAEINSCTSVSYDNSKISAILAMATILLAVLLAFYVLLFIALYGNSDEKYREVSSRHTEPN